MEPENTNVHLTDSGRTARTSAEDVLRAFFQEVAQLTSRHEVIQCGSDDLAVVYPSRLGDALSRVDPDWWKNTSGVALPEPPKEPQP